MEFPPFLLFILSILPEEARYALLLFLRAQGLSVVAQSRTAKGTNSSKSNSNTLTISNVSTLQNRLLVAAVAWENDNDGESPSVVHGNQPLHEIERVQQGDTILAVFAARSRNTKAGTSLTATWPSNLSARAMLAVELEEASFIDQSVTNTETSVTAPDTGSAGTSTVADTISLGFFAVLGPGSDNPAPTGGSGHTLGQEASTSGGTAVDNITLYDTFELLTATGTIQASLTSMANARDVASMVIAFRIGPTYTVNRALYIPWDGYPGQESIAFVMEDSGNNEQFQVRIPREKFNELSDIEVEDFILAECIWWADKQDGAPSPSYETDSTFDSRVSSFVNDTFTT